LDPSEKKYTITDERETGNIFLKEIVPKNPQKCPIIHKTVHQQSSEDIV
jgi:hypothetical protein